MNINYKSRVDKLVEKAKQKGLVKTYAQVCETTWGKESMLSEEEVKYYASSKKIVKYSIGDIVFVENYLYKSGEVGQRHIFVIVNEGEVVSIIGPSGSGKNDITKQLCEDKRFASPKTYCTKQSPKHKYLTEEEFEAVVPIFENLLEDVDLI